MIHDTSSPVMPPDYSLVTSYVPLPLHTCLPAIILHVESPTHLFVCPAAHWEELNRFQTHLQSVATTMDQGTSVQPVVGQLVMIRSEQDNLWYRGTVIKLHKSKAKIYCPDYGFVEKISVSNILPLWDSDVKRAYWARHCTLVDWGEGMLEATMMEVERLKQMLPVTKHGDVHQASHHLHLFLLAHLAQFHHQLHHAIHRHVQPCHHVPLQDVFH